MEVYQEPEGDSGVQSYTEPTELLFNTNSRRVDAAESVALKQARGEKDTTSESDEIMDSPSRVSPTSAERADKFFGMYVSDVEKSVEASIAKNEPVDAPKVAEGIKSVKAAATGPYEGHTVEAEVHPQAHLLTDEQKEDFATVSYLQQKSAEVLDEMSYWDGVSDWSAMLLTPDKENIRMAEVADLIGMDYSLKDGINYADFLGRLSTRIRSLPEAEAKKAIDTIVDGWEDILGDNRLTLGLLLTDLTGEYGTDMKTLEAGIGTADQVASALVIPAIVTRLIKSVNLINKATKVKNIKGLSAATHKGLNGGMAEHGVDVEDAVGSLLPVDKIDTLSPGANNEMALENLKEASRVQVHLDEVDRVNSYGLGLTEAEQEASIARKMKAMEEEEGLVAISVVERDSKGFTLTYSTGSSSDAVNADRRVSYTIDDTGAFISDGQAGYNRFDGHITSPNYRFHADRRSLVQIPEQLQGHSALVKDSYHNAMTAAVGHLDNKSYARVDSLLLKGDDSRTVWSRNELLYGVDGVKYTEAEADAYQGVRQVIDHMYHAKDKQIVDGWRAANIKMVQWGADSVPAKLYDEADSAATAFRQANTRTHVIGRQVDEGGFSRVSLDSPSDLDIDWLREEYGKGYKLVRPSNNKLLNAGTDGFEWALVKADDLSVPTIGVLGRHTGYVPRMRKGGNFFVKRATERLIGGKKFSDVPETVRYFDNYKDATLWASRQEDSSSLSVLADGELTAEARDMEYTNISGGIITGARKQTEIPFGLEEQGLKASREDALAGLQVYVNHLAKQMPYGMYRMGLRQKWENTARELGAINKNTVGGFDEIVTHLDTKHPAYGFLKDAHNQVSLVSGVPTDAERAARATSEGIAHWLDRSGTLGNRIAAHLHGKNISAEVSGKLRGATFHTLLGAYNPAQYLVQASGALIALSINPLHATKAIGQSLAFQVLDRMVAKNPANLDEYLKAMDKLGIDSDGYRLWNKSGLKQTITSSNIDYESLWSDLPYDAGVIRKVLGNDTFFFKSGELVSARISFATAYNRWKSLNKGKEVGESDLIDILARTEQYRLNMSKANTAKFQTGMASIPTQFQQVNTKFMEKLLGTGELTAAEKGRMLAGQTAFFGAIGIPLVGYIAPVFMEALGITAETKTEEELTVIRNGALTWAFNDYMDINSVITGRMTLGGDIVKKVFDTLSEPVVGVEILAGPSYSIYEKGQHAVFNIWTAMNADFSAEGLDVNKMAMVSKIVAESAALFAPPVANTLKAWDMTHSPFYKNRAGKPIFEWTDMNTQTAVFQALGFSTTAAQDFYEINNRHGGMIPASNRNMDAKRIVYIMNQLGGDDKNGNKEAVLYAMSLIDRKYKGKDRKKLRKQVSNLLKSPDDAWGKSLEGLFKEWDSELSTSFGDTVRMANAKTNPTVAREMKQRGMR